MLISGRSRYYWYASLRWWLIATLLPLTLLGGAGVRAETAHRRGIQSAQVASIAVKGETTTWRLSLLRIGSTLRIPHVNWVRGYRANYYRFFILSVQLTNTGSHMADPFDDLVLTLKVKPPYPTKFTPGWTSLSRKGIFVAMYNEVVHDYGGAYPWQTAKPGSTIVYTYLIATNRGDSHYGLYNAPPYKSYVFLTNTGF